MSRRFVFAVCMGLVSVAGCAGNGAGGCPEPCASTQVCCDGRCVFTQIDVNHCGACGNVCNGTCGGGICTPGPGIDGGTVRPDATVPNNCRPECSSTQRCCGTNCVDRSQTPNVDGRPASTMDPRSPFNNCNGCGLRCDPERAISCSIRAGASTPECACGDFAECLVGEVCANDGGRWQCVNTSTNPRNCGSLGNVCAEGEVCQAGNCVCGSTGTRCGDGQSCCGGTCIDTSTDSANCGGCGRTCTPNAPDCQGGTCTCAAAGRACTAPMGGGIPLPGMGGGTGESCCPGMGCVANTNTSCNCMACGSGESCVVGGSGFFGMGGSEISTVCCGDPFQVAILGCGGFGFPGLGDGGFGFPDGGLPGFP